MATKIKDLVVRLLQLGKGVNMRVHTSAFKEEIAKNGRQIDARVYAYGNYNLITEASDSLLTENNLQLIAEQINYDDKTLIDSELIYNIHILKHGNLLQSLMKQVNLELKYDLNVGNVLNVQFGVLVGNDYEYLDYGNYIIYSKEYNANNETWNYVCYDKMLYSMIKYKPLDITYPCTIREYISAIADRLGLEFANSSDTFTNYNQPIANELFENQNVSYRDVLDKLSEIVAGNILINDDDELEIKYATATNDTIDETNLKDINVNFGETFGPINKVSIQETDGGYEYPAENSASIQSNGLTQINIVDNEFAFNGYTETIAQAILTQLSGLTYSINDFATTGVCYYDFMDLFNVSIGENTYPCLLLNNEINIEQGLTETIFMQKEKNSQTKEDEYIEPIMSNKEVQFKINQQEGKIEARVEKDGVINAINLSEEGTQILASKLGIEATDILDIIAGNQINLTAKNITIASDNFNVDNQGNCTANSFNSNNATITGGNLTINANTNEQVINIKTSNNTYQSRVYPSHFYQTNGTQALTIGSYTSTNGYGLWLRDYDNTAPEVMINISNNVSRIVLLDQSSQGYELNSQVGLVEISDKRKKEKINYIPEEISKNIIENLNPIEYCLIGKEQKYRGLIAQEVEEVLKQNKIENEIYLIDENGDYSLVYNQFIADIINTEKYLLKQIETLQNKIEELERKVK
jgi:hypothetical protein